jgi:hypothetical protein
MAISIELPDNKKSEGGLCQRPRPTTGYIAWGENGRKSENKVLIGKVKLINPESRQVLRARRFQRSRLALPAGTLTAWVRRDPACQVQ